MIAGPSAAGAPVRQPPGGAARILVVDDHEDNVELLRARLEARGYRVEAASDGMQALERVFADPPDLVLLDVMMPGLSGIDVCRALRARPESADLPVILLTARSQEADVQAGFRAGADDYMTKPFSPRELVSRIDALLARRAR